MVIRVLVKKSNETESITMKATKRIHEFKALELKLTKDSRSPHTIYFKEHAVRDHTKDKPPGRTLFIVNIPPYVDEKGIVNAFRDAGPVETVQFAEKPSSSDIKPVSNLVQVNIKPSFRIAYLVFEKVSQLDKALKLTKLRPMNTEEHQIKVGMKKWIDEYNESVFQPKVLKEKVEEYMKKYDSEMKKAEKREKMLEEEDDDGWVTVTKKGKISSIARTEKVNDKITSKEEKKMKGKLELKNFYTFQIRESKMKHIVALRQKFEEDKQKIQQIKQSRRFKPF